MKFTRVVFPEKVLVNEDAQEYNKFVCLLYFPQILEKSNLASSSWVNGTVQC